MKKIISIYLPLLFASFIFASFGWANFTEGENTVQAQLLEITIITKFEGKAHVTHFDPNYVITLKRNDGSIEHYAIHSPSRLLGNEYKVGNIYNFIVVYNPSGDIKYSIRVINE